MPEGPSPIAAIAYVAQAVSRAAKRNIPHRAMEKVRRPEKTLIRLVFRERLVRHDGEGVFDTGKRLQLLDDEMADVHFGREIALHQEIVLAGNRVDLGDFLDVLDRFLGDFIGFAEIALHHHEDRLHGACLQPRAILAGRARNAGRWSPKPTTRRSSSGQRSSRRTGSGSTLPSGSMVMGLGPP